MPALQDSDSTYATLITHTGSVTLAYVTDGLDYILISNDFKNRWPSEILRESRALISIGKRKEEGIARLITEPNRKKLALSKFAKKYGQEYVNSYFNNPNRFIAVTPSEVNQASESGYYEWLEDEFDNIADEYDRHIFGNRVNKLLRNRSVSLMRDVFGKGKNLLEIGCGTGTETLQLLADGNEITATDISARMLESLKRKASEQGLAEQLRTYKVRAASIKEVVADDPGKQFDGIYSTYGALNCETSLAGIPEQIHSLMKDGGKFVAGVYNRFCLSETLLYLITLQFRKAYDRTRRFSYEGHSRFCVDIYSYSTREFLSHFIEGFTLNRIEGVPVIIPPSNLADYVEQFAAHFGVIDSIDRFIGRKWPFSHLGDHFLCVLNKK